MSERGEAQVRSARPRAIERGRRREVHMMNTVAEAAE